MSGGGRNGVRFVYFDVGGTLIHPHPPVGRVYAEVLTRRGFPCEADAVGSAFEEAWDEAAREVPPRRERYAWSPEGERGYWRDLLVRTVRRLGGDRVPAGAAEELFEIFGHRETWQVYPEVHPVLEELSRRGIRMGILSNWDSRLPVLLRELGLRRHFGPILVSALEGLEKPDPRFFRMAAERAGVHVSEMLHVGDRVLEDEAGARGAGCHALLVRIENGRPGLESVAGYLRDGGGPRDPGRAD
jgi:putative hydrolase of the HAD superfamily